ncbi:MAG: hypothetical protein KIT48_12065 [Pseudolabrys sp.]|nr:hypothetical protein [Pseudolabrys sp.]
MITALETLRSVDRALHDALRSLVDKFAEVSTRKFDGEAFKSDYRVVVGAAHFCVRRGDADVAMILDRLARKMSAVEILEERGVGHQITAGRRAPLHWTEIRSPTGIKNELN